VQELHLLKTDLFMQLIETGAMPLRSGVKRLVSESQLCLGLPATLKRRDALIKALVSVEVSNLIWIVLWPDASFR